MKRLCGWDLSMLLWANASSSSSFLLCFHVLPSRCSFSKPNLLLVIFVMCGNFHERSRWRRSEYHRTVPWCPSPTWARWCVVAGVRPDRSLTSSSCSACRRARGVQTPIVPDRSLQVLVCFRKGLPTQRAMLLRRNTLPEIAVGTAGPQPQLPDRSGHCRTSTGRMWEKMSDRMSEDMPDRMPERMSERMSEDMPDRMPEDMPERMSEDMSDRMSEDMPDRMPEKMSEDMPDRMSERMSEDMPERMS